MRIADGVNIIFGQDARDLNGAAYTLGDRCDADAFGARLSDQFFEVERDLAEIDLDPRVGWAIYG